MNAIVPAQQVYALDIEHTGTLSIAIVKVLFYLVVWHKGMACRQGATGAMATGAVATVGNEQHALQWLSSAKEPGPDEPPTQVDELLQRLHDGLPERDGEQYTQQGEVARTLVVDDVQCVALTDAVHLQP